MAPSTFALGGGGGGGPFIDYEDLQRRRVIGNLLVKGMIG